MDIALFLLGALFGWFVSRHYYQRSKSDADSSESRRDARDTWRRSVNYFEYMLTSATWEKRYIDNLVTWICPSDSSLKIVIPDSTSEFTEDWTERHPDPRGRRADIQLRVNDSTIQELAIHSLGRRSHPRPYAKAGVRWQQPRVFLGARLHRVQSRTDRGPLLHPQDH